MDVQFKRKAYISCVVIDLGILDSSSSVELSEAQKLDQCGKRATQFLD